ARRKLRAHGIEHGLALRGLLEEPVGIDNPDLGLGPGRQRGQRAAGCNQPHRQLGSDQTLHGTLTSYAMFVLGCGPRAGGPGPNEEYRVEHGPAARFFQNAFPTENWKPSLSSPQVV